jgi:hypothetical protein
LLADVFLRARDMFAAPSIKVTAMTEDRGPHVLNYFLLSFSRQGFEVIIDITDDYYDNTTEAIRFLSEKPQEPNAAEIALSGLMMRARFHDMGVYSLMTEKSITRDDLWQMAQESPQALVNLCRSHGVRYTDFAIQTLR